MVGPNAFAVYTEPAPSHRRRSRSHRLAALVVPEIEPKALRNLGVTRLRSEPATLDFDEIGRNRNPSQSLRVGQDFPDELRQLRLHLDSLEVHNAHFRQASRMT